MVSTAGRYVSNGLASDPKIPTEASGPERSDASLLPPRLPVPDATVGICDPDWRE
jgi:hypothetical protein